MAEGRLVPGLVLRYALGANRVVVRPLLVEVIFLGAEVERREAGLLAIEVGLVELLDEAFLRLARLAGLVCDGADDGRYAPRCENKQRDE